MKLVFRRPFLYSLVLHGSLLAIFLVSFDWQTTHYVIENAKPESFINATVIDAPLQPIKKLEPVVPPKPQPVLQPKHSTPVTTPIKKDVIVIPDKRKQLKAKEERAKQLLADLKKQTAEDKKHMQTEKQKALEKALEKEMQALNVTAHANVTQNDKRPISDHPQRSAGIVNQYKALIIQAISQRWMVPPGANKNAVAELLIRLAPGGVVLEVQLVKSSGDAALDRSARAAVFKASPLPVPTANDGFDAFRQFILKVKPLNVMQDSA